MNKGSTKARFLTTVGCSLCDEAFDMLLSAAGARGLSLVVIDVADDASFDEFAERIPVVQLRQRPSGGIAGVEDNPETWVSLFWPFSADELNAWLEKQAES